MAKVQRIYSLALLGLLAGITGPVRANYPYCTVHCGWYLEVEPFYAKATDTLLTNSIYAVKASDFMILGDFKEEYHLDIKSAWGGRIAVGYDFPSCCPNYNYGFSLEYTFFDHDNSASVNNDGRDHQGFPVLTSAEFIDIATDAALFSHADSTLSQRYDTVDLLANKNMVLSPCLDVKVFGGVRYFHLRERLHNHLEFNGLINGTPVQNLYDVNFKNETNDIGPHIGAGMFYRIFEGVGVLGQLTASLLYGESESEFHNVFAASTGPLEQSPASLTSSNHHDDSAHVIPALSGKVALAYQVRFRNCSTLMLEVGYRGDRYFHAADDVAFQQLLAGDDINSNCNYQDFDLTGPYFSLTLHA